MSRNTQHPSRLTFYVLRFTPPPRWLLPALIFVIALLFRLAPLGRYVTPDEPAWVYRSVRFADALAARDWAATPSTGHPGVTTMWLGALGVIARRLTSPDQSAAHLDWIRHMAWLAPENGAAFRHLAWFLSWGRAAVGLTTALGLVGVYGLTAWLFDRRVALLTAGLLVLDPFLIGHSGLLHTDALLATFSMLCVLCLLGAARGESRAWAWSLGSGAAAGLALLTKSLGVFLLPFAALVLGTAWLGGRMPFKKMLALSLVWGLSCGALYWALYPAMWVAPWQTLNDLYGAPSYHAGAALMPTFFAGRTALEHGPEFYAVALPWRLSPVVLVGLLLSLRKPSRRLEVAWLWLFALGYVLLLASNAKKYDRYLLSIFPPLALAAALALSRIRLPWRGEIRRRLNPLVLLGLQLLLLLPFVLYPLTYYNPLLGGPPLAARWLPTGWGEGMGAAARWLNQQPQAQGLTVAALSVPTFAALFDGHTVSLDQAPLADYVVRAAGDSPAPAIYTARLGFLDQAAVYANSAPSEQAAYLETHAKPDDLILLDAETPLSRQYSGPGTLRVTPDLDEASRARRVWLVADPGAAPITAARLYQGLQAMATPVTTATVAAARIVQFVPQGQPSANLLGPPYLAALGRQITLVDALLPSVPVNAPFDVFLRWQVPAPTPTDLSSSLHLLDLAGRPWAQVGQLVLNQATFATSAWSPGEWSDQALKLELPARLPPGPYTVQLTLADAGNAQLGAWDAADQFIGVRVPLGQVEIAPPNTPVGPAPCASGASLIAAPFLACVSGSPPRAVPSGDAFTLALTWSAQETPGADYEVRWRLLDAAGAVALQRTVPLSPHPTSRWRPGDSFESRYDLRLNPTLPATTYDLAFNVLSPDGGALWPDDEMLTTVEVLARERLFQLPEIAHPLDLRLGDVVRLRGFDLERSQAAPGETLPLTLYWQAGGPTDLDYTVFVHLVGPDGQSHGQVDCFPAAGAAPTTSWADGQVVVDEMALPVAADAPAGLYHVAVGMYDAASGGRLPVNNAAGQLLPGAQAVLPLEITIGP
jgi:4-amino-4-deoxy-L-arabinose transferase-like glycosyltransferase